MTRSAKSLEPIIKQLYQARNELRALFPELPFTLDGRLVGDIGEAIALQEFGLSPLPSCSELHDFLASDGRRVQIKTTQGIISGRWHCPISPDTSDGMMMPGEKKDDTQQKNIH